MDDDGADPRDFAVVPNVVGMTTWEALHTARGQGFDVFGPDPDGTPVTAATAGMAARISSQHPAPGTVARRFTAVEIRVDGGGTAGVREPRRPPPRSSAGAGEGDPAS